MIRKLILLLTLGHLALSANGQVEESVYDSKAHHEDLTKIKKFYGWVGDPDFDEREMDAYIQESILIGPNDTHDSIAFLTIKRDYYYEVHDVVNDMYSQLKLVAFYSQYLTDKELESLNRKIGEAYLALGNSELAREFFTTSKSYGNEEVSAYIESQIGSCFLQMGDLDSALAHYGQAFDLSKAPDRLQHLNSLGYINYLRKDYLNSAGQFREALNLFHEEGRKDSIHYLIIQSNLSSLNIAMGESDAGLQRLHWVENSHAFQTSGDWFMVEIYSKLVAEYLAQGQCGKSRQYLRALEEKLLPDPFSSNRIKYLNYRLECEINCAGSKASISNALDDLNEQLKANEQHFQDQSMIVEKLQHSVYIDQLALVSSNLSLKKESEAALALSNTRLKRLVWISIILLIFVIAIVIAWYRRKQKQQQRKESLLVLQDDLLQEKERTSVLQIEVSQKDLENRKLELSGMLQTADRNSSLFEEVNARLIKLRDQEGDVKEDITQLLQFMRAMSKTDELNTLIEQNSDIIDGKFKERVEKKFPNLSKSDLQLIVLMKLGLSTKEIAQLKNVEPASIRIFKHRLKGKLDLSKEVDLNAYISELN